MQQLIPTREQPGLALVRLLAAPSVASLAMYRQHYGVRVPFGNNLCDLSSAGADTLHL